MIPESSMTTDNPNKTNLYDKSSLILAISYGHCHIITLLLDKGADVDLVTEYGDWSFEGAIALQTPCEASFEAIGGLLLDRGANINARYGKTQVEICVCTASYETYSFRVATSDFNQKLNFVA